MNEKKRRYRPQQIHSQERGKKFGESGGKLAIIQSDGGEKEQSNRDQNRGCYHQQPREPRGVRLARLEENIVDLA